LKHPVDENKERIENEQILLSKKQNRHLSKDEVIRLKTFGLREPKLCEALKELAAVLENEVVPKVERLFNEAVKEFGFERFP
jgi:hypothetical protein